MVEVELSYCNTAMVTIHALLQLQHGLIWAIYYLPRRNKNFKAKPSLPKVREKQRFDLASPWVKAVGTVLRCLCVCKEGGCGCFQDHRHLCSVLLCSEFFNFCKTKGFLISAGRGLCEHSHPPFSDLLRLLFSSWGRSMYMLGKFDN